MGSGAKFEIVYNALRAEILKRIESRQQIMLATLTFFGVILGYGIKSNTSPLVILTYPIISFCLALSWSQVNFRLGQLGYYIRKKIEPKFYQTDPWEKYIRKPSKGFEKFYNFQADKITFIISQAIAIGVGFLRKYSNSCPNSDTLVFRVFVIVDALALCGTYLFMARSRPKDWQE